MYRYSIYLGLCLGYVLFLAISTIDSCSSGNSTNTNSSPVTTPKTSLEAENCSNFSNSISEPGTVSVSTSSSTGRLPSTSQTPLSASPASSYYSSSSSAKPTASVRSSPVSSSSFSSSSPTLHLSSPPPTMSSTSPTGKSTVQETNSSISTTERGTTPGNTTTTAPPEKKFMKIFGLLIAYFAILVLVAGTFHWISRQKKTKPAKETEFEMDASALCGSAATTLGEINEPEVGITHQAFAEGSESPENAIAPESQEVTVLFSNDTKF